MLNTFDKTVGEDNVINLVSNIQNYGTGGSKSVQESTVVNANAKSDAIQPCKNIPISNVVGQDSKTMIRTS
jgi:hypothetical protein